MSERVGGVVHQDDVLYLAVLDDAHVLQEEAFLGFETVVPVDDAVDILLGGVDEVDYFVGVVLSTGSEYIYFVYLAQLFQEVLQVGPEVDSDADVAVDFYLSIEVVLLGRSGSGVVVV